MASTKQPQSLDGSILDGTPLAYAGRETVSCDDCHIDLTPDDSLFVRAKQDGMDGDWVVSWITCPSCGPTAGYADPGYVEVSARPTFRPEAGRNGLLVVTNARLATEVTHLDWRF